jgi:hypothetical protein
MMQDSLNPSLSVLDRHLDVNAYFRRVVVVSDACWGHNFIAEVYLSAIQNVVVH